LGQRPEFFSQGKAMEKPWIFPQELHLDRVNTSVGVHQAQAYLGEDFGAVDAKKW